MPISQVSQQLNSVIMALAGAERIFDLMDEQPETDDGYVTLVNARSDENGQLVESRRAHRPLGLEASARRRHRDLHRADGRRAFWMTWTSATRRTRSVLHDITLYAKPGQKIAFVGATGAGKTTITNLHQPLLRHCRRQDPLRRHQHQQDQQGRSAPLAWAWCFRMSNLFTGTVMENIRYGKLDATDEECIAAAKLANADDFITRAARGLRHGARPATAASLSQGQRQLISIARAAVEDPPVMILDEATSSIDTRTESIVQKGMDALMKGRTVFVIAHRLSTVRNSDAIMVLDHGRIIERGSHADLIAQRGTYYRLYTGAFELE